VEVEGWNPRPHLILGQQGQGEMTHRERLLNTMRFLPVDRPPDYEWVPWQETLDRWHQEGMPESFNDLYTAIQDYWGTDPRGIHIGLHTNLLPTFEYKVLEEKGDHLIVQDTEGAVCEMLRPEIGPSSIPRYLRHALETRQDWERMRDERLNPDTPGRVPDDLDDLCQQSLDSDCPVAVSCGSVYGVLRDLMGLESMSVAIMEHPEWVVEMMTHRTELTLKLLEKLAGRCRIDYGVWWEDMCYKNGPLVSPNWFVQHMVPQYRKVTNFLRRECGCEFHLVDCDGNIHALVPLWLEAGVNMMLPAEVAHTDAYRIREQFGDRVAIWGHFDKRVLAYGPEAIDREFERIAALLAGGGFIPYPDHAVPPNVSLENFRYYRSRKLALLGKQQL